MDYLKDKRHYIDLYDLFTIKECLGIIEFWHKSYKERSNDKEIKDLPEEEKLKGFNYCLSQELYATKGGNYRRKKEAIREWMERDRIKQEKLDNTPEPHGIICSHCTIPMHMTVKHLEDYMNQPLRILFFFECPSCKKRRGIYDNGEEYSSKPQFCPKCHKEVKVTHKKKGEVITWITTCPSCGFTKKVVDDYEEKYAEWQKEEQEDKKLLEKYRDEFCLSDEKGKEYIEMIEKLKVAHEVFEEEKQKHDDPIYERSLQLKKLSVVELEKLLADKLEKEKYIKLSLEKPEIGQYVIVPFNIQDADSAREGRDSTSNLQNLIKITLDDTNWRLVNNSLSYRLGYVSGQLKGYEREEDMLELAGKKKEKKPSKEDYERRMRYSGDPIVQLAKMVGEHEGIENIRKRRLEKEPEGFFLKASEGSYTCYICRQTVPANNVWWNVDGLRCVDCQRNTQEGIIPPLNLREDNLFIRDWQLHSEHGVHSSTARKLRREGLLHGRDLKREDGSTYCTVYLISENQEFLRKYTKKPAMKIEFVNSGDKKVQL